MFAREDATTVPLEIKYKGLNVADVLNLTVNQASELFSSYRQSTNDFVRSRSRTGLSSTWSAGIDAFRGGVAARQAGARTGASIDRQIALYHG
jgi:hypothetical protein